MRVKLLIDNLLIGDKNYSKGDVLDYELDGLRKDKLVADGHAEATDEPAGKCEHKPAILPTVEDKATLFHPADDAVLGERGPDELKVTADSPIDPNGKPAKAKSK